ncbi:Central glycolytic genes regulator [Geobacillus sp. BCO2]|nr:Central glycolytic genes regulator [Geobacillus sp. BCO2]
MEPLVEALKKLSPDLLDVMQKRYEILHSISLMAPIGRRALAASLGMSERVLRSETEFLKGQNLLSADVSGMRLTEEGHELLHTLHDWMREALGLKELEAALQRKLGIPRAIVVAGDSDRSPWVKKKWVERVSPA